MMLKNRWKKAACLILTIISTVCLGKVDVKAADYSARCAGNTLTECYFDGKVHRHDSL